MAPQKSKRSVDVKNREKPREANAQLHHRFCSHLEATLLQHPCTPDSMLTTKQISRITTWRLEARSIHR